MASVPREVPVPSTSDNLTNQKHGAADQPSALQQQYNDQNRTNGQKRPGDQKQPNDQHKPTDKPKTPGYGAPIESKTVDPYKVMKGAQAASELLTLSSMKDDDKVTARDNSGRSYSITVAQLKASDRQYLKQEHNIELSNDPKEIKKFINDSCGKAVGAATAIVQTKADTLLKNNNTKVESVANQAGINTQGLTPDQIAEKIKTLPQAQDALQERDMIQLLRHAPAAIRMQAAELKSQGLTDPDATSAGPSTREVIDAYQLVREAGRLDTNASASPEFQQLNNKVTAQYADLQEGISKNVAEGLQKAHQLSVSGKTAEADAEYKKTLQTAESIDMKFLAAQLKDPIYSQNPEIVNHLVQTIQSCKEARMDYAKFLNSEGRYDEALPLVTKVLADTPELAKLDKTVDKVYNEALYGKSMPTGELKAHQLAYNEAISAKDYDKAKEELDIMRKGVLDEQAQMAKNSARLQTEKGNIQEQLKALENNKNLDDDQRTIEQQRLQRELAVIDGHLKIGEEVNKQSNWVKYLTGYLAWSKGDLHEAHMYFESVQSTSPEIANNPDLHLNDLLEDSRDRAWYENKALRRGVCIAGAVAVGLGTAAATVWSGPGSVAAGITAGTATLAVVGGTAASTLTYVGMNYGMGEQITARTWADGALLGLTSSSMVVTGPLLAGLAPEVGSTVVGANVLRTAMTSRLAAPAIVGFGSAGGQEALNVGFDGKPWGQAATDTLKWGALNTLAYRMIPGVGKAVPNVAAETIPNSFSQVMRTTGLGYMKYSPDMLVHSYAPGAINFYHAYSPFNYKAPVLGRPNHFGLDPHDPDDEKKLWQRYEHLNPGLDPP